MTSNAFRKLNNPTQNNCLNTKDGPTGKVGENYYIVEAWKYNFLTPMQTQY